MFIDSSLEFASDTAVPTTGTRTDNLMIGEIDLRPAGEDSDATTPKTVDFSTGEPLYVVVEVTAAITGVTQYAFTLFTDNEETTAGTTSNGALLLDTGLNAANIAVGKRFVFTLPEGEYQRYLTLHGRANTSATTGGTVTAFITKDVNNWSGSVTRVPATDPAN